MKGWLQSMWTGIAAWFKAKGGFAHVMAGLFLAAMAAYAEVPQFHALVLQIHAALPGWLQEDLEIGLALYAWYKAMKPLPPTTRK